MIGRVSGGAGSRDDRSNALMIDLTDVAWTSSQGGTWRPATMPDILPFNMQYNSDPSMESWSTHDSCNFGLTVYKEAVKVILIPLRVTTGVVLACIRVSSRGHGPSVMWCEQHRNEAVLMHYITLWSVRASRSLVRVACEGRGPVADCLGRAMPGAA